MSGARCAASWPPSTSAWRAAEYRDAMAALALPADRIPQLDEVSDRLRPLTGFQYRPAAGLVGFDEFYGSLADGVFHSTQYVRHHARPLYTPEPDLIHEVIGHGGLMASPRLAELNRLAGQASRRLETEARARLLRQGVLVLDRVRRPL